jgi:hypothetical protein
MAKKTNQKVAKVSRQARLQKILSGISSRFSGMSSIMLGGKTVVLSDLVKSIQTELDDIAASAQAKDAYAAQVQKERTARASLTPTLRQLKSYVMGSFGDTQDSVQALGDFGFTPRKVGKKTAAEKAQAQEKAKVTRAKETAVTPAPEPVPAPVPATKP